MELSPLPVEVFQACIVRAVRNSEALILRLAQRTEVLLQQAVSSSDSTQDMLHFRAWQAWTTHRSRLLTRYPQALLSVVGRYKPAAGDEATALGELSRQAPAVVEVIRKACELISADDGVEKAQEHLKSRFAQLLALDGAQDLPNPLHSSIYVLAFVRSLNNPALEVDVLARWLESMQEHLCRLLVNEYDYLARFVYDRGLLGPLSTDEDSAERVQAASDDAQERAMAQRREESWRAPQRYGDAMAQSRAYARQISGYDTMLTQLIGQLSRDQRWIDGSQKVPDLSPDLLASLRMGVALLEEAQNGSDDTSTESLTMSARSSEAGLSDDRGAKKAIESESSQQAAEIVQQVLAEITNGTNLLPEIQHLLRQLEPVLQQLALNDHSFVHHSEHPARHWVEELVGRSQRFPGEQSEEFIQFIQVAEVAVMQLQTSLMPDAATFEIVLEAMVKEWSRPDIRTEVQSSGRSRALLKPELPTGQAASPNVQFIAKAVRQLTNTAQAPADIIEFLNETWVQVVVHAYGQQAEVAGAEGHDESRQYRHDDAGSYLSMIPGLLWSVGPKAIQDTQRLSLLAPRLQEKLVQGLSRIGKTSEYVQQITARLAGIYQDTLDASLERIRQTSAGLDLDLYLDLSVPTTEPAAQVDILLDLDEFIGDEEAQQPVLLHGAEPQEFSAGANYDLPAAIELAEEQEDFDVTQAVTDDLGRQMLEHAPEVQNQSEATQVAAEEPQSIADHDELFADARLLHAVRADVQQAMAVAGEEKSTEAGELSSPDQALAAVSIDWPIGTWLQLQNEEQKILTQLTWVNPEGKLFLFTSPDGSTQSMTRRTLDRLVAQGRLKRVIFANPGH